MITVSQPAYARLSEILSQRPADVCVRIYMRDGRAHVRPSRQRPGDRVIQHEGRPVLLYDEQAALRLNERTVGTHNTPDGPRLRLGKALAAG